MSKYLTKTNYVIAAAITTLTLSRLTKQMLKSAYSQTTGKKPPQNPEANDATLTQVVVFSFTTALVASTVKIIGRKLLARKWKGMDGKLPDHLS